MSRMRRIGFQLPAQLRHVNVHRPRTDLRLVLPDLGEEVAARSYRAAPLEQREQEVELTRRERHQVPGTVHRARGRIHLDVAEALDCGERRTLASLRATKQRVDPRD